MIKCGTVNQFRLLIILHVDILYDLNPRIGWLHFINNTWSLSSLLILLFIRRGLAYQNILIKTKEYFKSISHLHIGIKICAHTVHSASYHPSTHTPNTKHPTYCKSPTLSPTPTRHPTHALTHPYPQFSCSYTPSHIYNIITLIKVQKGNYI